MRKITTAFIFGFLLTSFLLNGQNAFELKFQEKKDSIETLIKKAEGEEVIKKKLVLLSFYIEEASRELLKRDSIRISTLIEELLDETKPARYKKYKGILFHKRSAYASKLNLKDQSLEYSYVAENIYESIDSTALLFDLLLQRGEIEENTDIVNAIKIYKKAIVIAEGLKDTVRICKAFHNLGIGYYFFGNYDSSLYAFDQQYKLSLIHRDTAIISRSTNTLGTIHYVRGNYSEALKFSLESLKLSELAGGPTEIGRSLISVANIYKEMNSDSLALRYYLRAIDILPDLELRHKAIAYNNLGILYQSQERYELAKKYYTQALQINIEQRDSLGMMSKYINLGSLNDKQENYDEAYKNYKKARIIAEKRKDKKRITRITINMADMHRNQNRINLAIANYNEAQELNNELKSKELQRDIYKGLSQTYKLAGNYSRSLDYYEKYSSIKDSLLNDDTKNAFAEMQTKYETSKKEQEIMLLNKEKALQDEKSKRDDLIKSIIFAGLIVVLVFLIFAFRQLRIIRHKNYLLAERNYEIQFQKEEIEHQKDEIEKQRDIVIKQKEEITDSIYYARRIQKAVLPREDYVNNIMPEHFILFRPRDIVSGDFYWIRQIGNKLVTIAADCTGHGVPGAFMSMLGVSFLNEIIAATENPEADLILNRLLSSVKTTLDQPGKADEAKDGIDISLCILDSD